MFEGFFSRLISSIGLVIIAAVTIWQGGYLLAIVLLLVSFAGYRELGKACKFSSEKSNPNPLEVTGFAAIAAYYAVMVFSGEGMLLLLMIILSLVAFMFVYVFAFPKYHADQVMAAFFCLIYAPVMLSCIYLTRTLTYGIYIVWLIFISSWIYDTCAYCVGNLLGRHKIAPKLSPHKSTEGVVGGIAGAAIVGALYGYFVVNSLVPEQEITWIFALISGVGAIIAQVGDLAASAIKRNHNIKDYGKLIPGHGGIMDRFDSVIFTAPIIYLLGALLINQI